MPKTMSVAYGKGPTLCSIDGCTGEVRARGWCSKHYARWQTHGDPLSLSARLKGEPNAAVVETRWIRGRRVSFTVDGRAFTETVRNSPQGKKVSARRYGTVFVCEGCNRETFSPSSGLNRWRFCSHACAGKGSSREKLGKSRQRISRKSQRERLDRWFSALIRVDQACVNCGTRERIQCAHGFSRRYLAVRWDARNAFPLCAKCHMYFTHRPLEWDEWLRSRWGPELYDELRARALAGTLPDYDEVAAMLVAEIRARDLTIANLPKTTSGWVGLRGSRGSDD